MSKSIRMCGVKTAYLDYLRQFDNRVSFDTTQTRKFIGILFEVNGHAYYAPLSSPKPRHANISAKSPDIFKIQNGTLGVINLNNMIPIHSSAIIPINISTIQDIQYQQLLNKQLLEIRTEENTIKKKAHRLYRIVTSGKQPKLNARCCDFTLLEEMAVSFGVISPTAEQEIAVSHKDEPQ